VAGSDGVTGALGMDGKDGTDGALGLIPLLALPENPPGVPMPVLVLIFVGTFDIFGGLTEGGFGNGVDTLGATGTLGD
jgi:hypothetical protein